MACQSWIHRFLWNVAEVFCLFRLLALFSLQVQSNFYLPGLSGNVIIHDTFFISIDWHIHLGWQIMEGISQNDLRDSVNNCSVNLGLT